MNYNEALNFIISKQSLGIQPGLTRISALLEIMGNPQDKLCVIHIAGTNGKGTVANAVANALVKSGYTVGLFTSPWVTDYREQIQLNGRFIPEEVFAAYVDDYKDCDATEFELLTAIMYKYFADSRVDYAVVECGMGGEGDSTNALKHTEISVITSVALDHTNFLGSTLEEIAAQKSGIIKPDSICVLYPNPKCSHIFEKKCEAMNTKLIKIAELGDYRKNNLAVANAVLRELGIVAIAQIPDIPARQERINGIMLDGAHNVDGALALKKNLPNKEITALIGMMHDKDIDGYLSVIAPSCNRIITTTPSNPRAISAKELKAIAEKYCSDVIAIDHPLDAVRQKNISLVCGSFFLARDVRDYLRQHRTSVL